MNIDTCIELTNASENGSLFLAPEAIIAFESTSQGGSRVYCNTDDQFEVMDTTADIVTLLKANTDIE